MFNLEIYSTAQKQFYQLYQNIVLGNVKDLRRNLTSESIKTIVNKSRNIS